MTPSEGLATLRRLVPTLGIAYPGFRDAVTAIADGQARAGRVEAAAARVSDSAKLVDATTAQLPGRHVDALEAALAGDRT